jgi:16S rRNA (cytosine967-C5)-methyltransferase
MGATKVRRIAIETLYQAEINESYINLALNARLAKEALSRRDRALLSQLVYTVARQQGTADVLIKQHLKGDLEGLPAPIRAILRLAATELRFMRTPPHTVVNQAVELAKIFGHKGTAALVNGVLRSLLRTGMELNLPSLEEDPVTHIAGTYSHPPWLVHRWVENFGTTFTVELCQANNEPPPMTVRGNSLLTNRNDLMELFREQGMTAVPTQYTREGIQITNFYSITGLKLFQEGYFTVQDESSILVAPALLPEPEHLVVDLCSAPGGKVTHVAALMGNRGRILAFDVHEHKVQLVQKACQRLKVHNVVTELMDARDILREKPHLIGQVHRVLVDAPCSGLGVLRRRPDARWRKNPEEISQLVEVQRELLSIGVSLLRPGGRLVFSTCSFEPEETRENTQWLLANFPLEPAPLQGVLPSTLPIEPGAFQITLYPHIHRTDGFFMATFIHK